MIIFPAIDIKNGKVVRLLQGKFDQVTEYAEDPLVVARKWITEGARWLHLVDLDGAKTGTIQNKQHIINIARTLNVPVQMGGGIRTAEDVQSLIEGGVARVILGTKVVEDITFLKTMLEKWPDKIAVSLDCHNGYIAQSGWTKTSKVKALDFVHELEQLGLKCLIYTDIARDGMLTGPNYPELEKILDTAKIPVIASGGIAHIDDIKRLKKLTPKGLLGAITGKAIYEGKLSLKEALSLC